MKFMNHKLSGRDEDRIFKNARHFKARYNLIGMLCQDLLCKDEIIE